MTRSFSRITSKRLPELVADQIEDAIIRGDFIAGSQLPSEQQLADQFDVSRNVVREAFKYLQERGLIDIVNGSGAYVSQPSAAPTSNALGRYIRLLGHHDSIEALYEARRLLEGNNARLAAERADENDLLEMVACIERMRGAENVEVWSLADLEFHLAIARATHNPFMSLLLEPLVDQLKEVIAEGYQMPGAVERGLAAHIRLMEAVQKRDAGAAYAAIMEHLGDSEAQVDNFNAAVSSSG